MRPIVSRFFFVGLGSLSIFAAIVVLFYSLRTYPQVATALARLGNNLAAADEYFSTSGRLESIQSALAATRSPDDRWTALGDAAMLTAQHGDPDQAEAYAKELLQLAGPKESDWNYGNAIHHGNLALGFVALRRGDVAGAKTFLLEAGKTPGSPQLNSFGPNMSLAKALIERGEGEVVLQYFAQCEVFWETHDGDLAKWAELVKEGVVPDFGAHLHY